MDSTHEASVSQSLSFTGTATDRVVRNLAMTPEANELLCQPCSEDRHE